MKRAVSSLLTLTALLALSWLVVYIAGGTSTVPPHLVYVPVLLAGWRFGITAAVLTGVAGGILVGPLLPADVSRWTAQPVSDWAVRTGFFAGIGGFVAGVMGRWRTAASHEVHVAKREQELALRESVFLQTASHELRTPLTVLMGGVRTLQQRGFVAETGAPLVESLGRAVDQLDRLCTIALASVGVLDDITASHVEIVDLRDMFLELADELDARGRVLLHTPARRVRTQPRVLRPALSALLDNALRFSPPGEPVEVVSSVGAGRARIAILDFGPGFDPAFIGRAFDPFTQGGMSLRRERGGLGVGLFAARRLVEQLGGSVSIMGREGGGAEVAVVLPEAATVNERMRREVRL